MSETHKQVHSNYQNVAFERSKKHENKGLMPEESWTKTTSTSFEHLPPLDNMVSWPSKVLVEYSQCTLNIVTNVMIQHSAGAICWISLITLYSRKQSTCLIFFLANISQALYTLSKLKRPQKTIESLFILYYIFYQKKKKDCFRTVSVIHPDFRDRRTRETAQSPWRAAGSSAWSDASHSSSSP